MTSTSQGAGASRLLDLQAHRGGRDARPENTLCSYAYAIECGATTIECDMQMTKDGHIVMSHNATLNPDITTDAQGRRIHSDALLINQMTLEELRSFDVGHMDTSCAYYELHGRTQQQHDARIPTLRELFELVSASGDPHVRMNIETKSYPDPTLGMLYEHNSDMAAMVRGFHDLVCEFGFQRRVTLQSFDWSTLVRMRHIDPTIETVALYSEQPSWGSPDATTLWIGREAPSPWLAGIDLREYDNDPAQAAHDLGIDDVSPYYGDVTEELVREAHDLGMKVVPWTVNDVAEMESLYAKGVDSIITDRPMTLRKLLESKGATRRDGYWVVPTA